MKTLSIEWIPLAIFLSGAVIAVSTGSSWGTMGLLMPLALSATLSAATSQHTSPELLATLIPSVIGAVFGGAVLGDHCSPFSDTTIVSSIASGCETTSHVTSQLPFVLIAAACSILAYSLIATGLHATIATGLSFLPVVLLMTKLTARQRA